jgi:hypothetical protein
MSVVIADHFFLFAEEYGRYTVAGAAKDPIIFLRSSACASVTGDYRRRSELTTEQVNHQIGPLVAKTRIRSTPIDAASEAGEVPSIDHHVVQAALSRVLGPKFLIPPSDVSFVLIWTG